MAPDVKYVLLTVKHFNNINFGRFVYFMDEINFFVEINAIAYVGI